MHAITPLSLTPTLGILPQTLCRRSPGFHHQPAPAQRGDAPGSALQPGPDARLGGRTPIFEGVLLSPRHHFTSVTVVSDSSVFQTGRFLWRDGSSWVYADWSPGKPRPTSTLDNCVELLGRAEVPPSPSDFSDVFNRDVARVSSFNDVFLLYFQQMESLTTKDVVKPSPSSAPTQNS